MFKQITIVSLVFYLTHMLDMSFPKMLGRRQGGLGFKSCYRYRGQQEHACSHAQ
jgi:hypothetical protein